MHEEVADLTTFERHRSALMALAYRMLGDFARAEDMVQETWIRWSTHKGVVENPRSYLLTIAARLCLNELDSARARREESRVQLPEPIAIEEDSEDALEIIEQVSMAFLVALQRLSPAERAVLVLHEVFDLSHAEIAMLLGKTEASTRQMLRRARQGVADASPVERPSMDDHRRLLHAFTEAARKGDIATLVSLLAEDATMLTDGGPGGARLGRIRNLPRPLTGGRKIAAFVAAASRQESNAEHRVYMLNGQPAMVRFRDRKPFAALFLAIASGKIVQIFIQADPARLRQIMST